MEEIKIDNLRLMIQKQDYDTILTNFKKRVFKILYLKDDYMTDKIKEYDVISYINALSWDLYGAYKVFNNYKFLNCICELEGIKENVKSEFVRKKVLDLGSYISLIKEG